MRDDPTLSKAPRPVTPSGIIARNLEQLKVLSQAMDHRDDAFEHLLAETAAIASGLEPYLTACTTPESAALATLSERTRSEDWAGKFAGGDTSLPLEQEMLSGHLEGQLLKMLVRSTRACRVLEIGLFTGYSALAIAEALPDQGMLVACEIDPFAAAFAQRAFDTSPCGDKIRVEVGPALDTLHRLAAAGDSFDFVFIDADKGNYRHYLEILLNTGLLGPNALVCVDNTLMQCQPYAASAMTANGRAIADFNRWVADDDRVAQVLLPVRDGITLLQRV